MIIIIINSWLIYVSSLAVQDYHKTRFSGTYLYRNTFYVVVQSNILFFEGFHDICRRWTKHFAVASL